MTKTYLNPFKNRVLMPYTSIHLSPYQVNQLKKPMHQASTSSLPNDILGCIFKYLDNKDFFNCQKVCKTWRNFLIDLKDENPLVISKIWQSKDTAENLIDKMKKFQNLNIKIVAKKLKKTVINLTQHGMVVSINWIALNQMNRFGKWEIQRFNSLSEMTQKKERYIYNCTAAIYNIFKSHQSRSLSYYDDNEEYKKDRQDVVRSLFTYIPCLLSIILEGFNVYDFYVKEKEIMNQSKQETVQEILDKIAYPHALNEDLVLKNFLCNNTSKLPLVPVLDTLGNRYDYVAIKDHSALSPQLKANTELDIDELIFDQKAFFAIQRRLKDLKEKGFLAKQGMQLQLFKMPSYLNMDLLD